MIKRLLAVVAAAFLLGACDEPAPPPAAAPPPPPVKNFLVFFDFDQSTLGAGAQSVLDAVASEVSKRSLNSITVVGHADTSGSESYNQKLAMRRAEAVRQALVQRGISASMIKTDSRGELEPLVQTADGVREPANRRAQISFQ